MWPTSIACSIVSFPPQFGQESPSLTRLRSAKSASKSRPAWAPFRCRSSRLAPTTYCPSRNASSARTRTDEHAECRGQLGFIEPVVPADQSKNDLLLDDYRHRLRGRARVDLQEGGDVLDRPHPRRLDLFRRLENGGEIRRRGNSPRGLDVGSVVAVLTANEVVLAPAGSEEVVAVAATHLARLGLDLVELQPAALEGPAVGLGVLAEAVVQAGLIAIE